MLIQMTLQDTYYLVGIIYMILNIFFLIAIVILLFYIKNKLSEVSANVTAKVAEVRYLVNHPKQTAMRVGLAVADAAISKVIRFFGVNSKDEA